MRETNPDRYAGVGQANEATGSLKRLPGQVFYWVDANKACNFVDVVQERGEASRVSSAPLDKVPLLGRMLSFVVL